MATQRSIFLNLPVADLPAARAFFDALGFTFEPKFTDETAACMVVNDHAFAMLLTHEKFSGFTSKPIADPSAATAAIFAVSAESREAVDAFADAALGAGGSPANDPMDFGFMYGRSFHDLDGHLWEVIWMSEQASDQEPADLAAAS